MPATDPSQLRAARRELRIVGLLLVAALVVLFLASRGTFNAMMMFPHIFGVIISVVALATLLTARGVLWRRRVPLVAAVIAVAAAAPIVHVRTFDRMLAENERQALAAIGGRRAPQIAFDHALGIERATSPMTVRDRVTLVTFWATWCSACRSEIPALRAFWREHATKGEIDLIGVTRLYGDEELGDIEAFVDENDIPYPTLVAGEEAHVAYRVDSLPSSVLIDRNGEVIAYGAGVSGTERLMREARKRAGS